MTRAEYRELGDEVTFIFNGALLHGTIMTRQKAWSGTEMSIVYYIESGETSYTVDEDKIINFCIESMIDDMVFL